MRKAIGVLPLPICVLVGTCQVDGVKPIIGPDGCSDQAKPEFVSGLVVHRTISFGVSGSGYRKGVRCVYPTPLEEPSGPKIPTTATNRCGAKLGV